MEKIQFTGIVSAVEKGGKSVIEIDDLKHDFQINLIGDAAKPSTANGIGDFCNRHTLVKITIEKIDWEL